MLNDLLQGFKITSAFGMRVHPISGGNKQHDGVDLVKPDKSPIQAFGSGEVVYAGTGKAGTGFYPEWGNVVGVRDNQGVVLIYAHLNKVSVTVGQAIKAGHVVGLQGATGAVTGSHLHLAARNGSRFIDPLDYLKRFHSTATGTTLGNSQGARCQCPPTCPKCNLPL